MNNSKKHYRTSIMHCVFKECPQHAPNSFNNARARSRHYENVHPLFKRPRGPKKEIVDPSEREEHRRIICQKAEAVRKAKRNAAT